jgi:uncharacterized integral membrane protein
MSNSVTVSSNPNWLTLLGVILVLLKLFSVHPIDDLSWWYVLMPFYIGIAILGGIVVGGALLAGVVVCVAHCADLIGRKFNKNKRKF